MRTLRGAVLIGVVCAASMCGGGGGGGNPGGPSPSDNPYQLTISAAGVISPKELVVPPGSRVLFINNHSRHNMTSDPHPEHNDCPEINQVGVLTQGQRRETGNLIVVRTCGVHDHDDPDNANVLARIVIR